MNVFTHSPKKYRSSIELTEQYVLVVCKPRIMMLTVVLKLWLFGKLMEHNLVLRSSSIWIIWWNFMYYYIVSRRTIPLVSNAYLFPWLIAGLGFLTSLVFIFLVGIFVSSWVGSTIFWVGEWFIKKMPFVRHIYCASKQVSTAVSPGTQLQFYVHQNVDHPYYFFKDHYSFL